MGFLPQVRKLLDETTRTARRCCSPRRSTATSACSLVSTRTTRSVTRSARPSPTSTADAPLLEGRARRPRRAHRRRHQRRTARRSCSAVPVTVPTASCKTLGTNGVRAAAPIHGGRQQSQRDRALAVVHRRPGRGARRDRRRGPRHPRRRRGVRACTSTSPADAKDYMHRSGRTARAGASGVVVSLVARHQVRDARKLQRAAGIEGEVEQPPAPSGVRRAPVRPEPESHARPSRSGPPRGGQSRNGQSWNGQSRNGQSRGGQPQRGRRRDGGRSGSR